VLNSTELLSNKKLISDKTDNKLLFSGKKIPQMRYSHETSGEFCDVRTEMVKDCKNNDATFSKKHYHTVVKPLQHSNHDLNQAHSFISN
jgi:hypothetical protein